MSISHYRSEVIKRGRNRKPRPKTFKSEQSAMAYAKANNIANFLLKNIKNPDSKKKKILLIKK